MVVIVVIFHVHIRVLLSQSCVLILSNRVAVERGDEQAIKLLSDNGASFGNMPKRTIDTIAPPEHCPTVSVGLSEVPKQGHHSNARRSSAVTYVASAAQCGDLDELVRLAAIGEHVDTVDAFGITPLRLVSLASGDPVLILTSEATSFLLYLRNVY
jgi:hypothetical protein